MMRATAIALLVMTTGLVSQANAKRFAVPFAGKYTLHSDVKKLRTQANLKLGSRARSAETLYREGHASIRVQDSDKMSKVIAPAIAGYLLVSGKKALIVSAASGNVPAMVGSAALIGIGAAPYLSERSRRREAGDLNVVKGVLKIEDAGKRAALLKDMKLETRRYARKQFLYSLKETQRSIKAGWDFFDPKGALKKNVADMTKFIKRLDQVQ